ncbi:MAG: hypothetical protein JXR86_17535 [Spirochaetales bacterium]|nr:hypothetical protein [Spirochaetales bacterium]
MVESGTKSHIFLNFLTIAYLIWIFLYSLSEVLSGDKDYIPDSIVYWIFLAVSLLCTILLVSVIGERKYRPFAIITALAAGGRFVSFSASVLFSSITDRSLYLLPFGTIDFFLFAFLSTGLLSYLENELEHEGKALSFAMFFPLLLFAIPVYVFLKGERGILFSLYSFAFTGTAVLTIIRALLFRIRFQAFKGFSTALILIVLSDMTVYLTFYPVNLRIPSGLPVLLVPLGLIMYTSTSLQRNEVSDD